MRKHLVVASIGALAACRAPTQLTVDVSADDAVCVPKLTTEISVGSVAEVVGSRPAATATTGCSGDHVGTVVLMPSGGDGDDVAFRVLASLDGHDCTRVFDARCIEARRALRFIPHEPLTVRVPLRAACEGVVCADPTTTCVEGSCVSASIDPNACTGGGCGEGVLGGGGAGDAGIDATVPDAGLDGTTSDAGADALDAAPTIDAGDASQPTVTLALGQTHVCALLLDGGVTCWGEDDLGQLGIGDAGDSAAVAPTHVNGIPAMSLIGGGGVANHTCVAGGDGAVFCWGSNDNDELGYVGGASGVPVAVKGLPPLGEIWSGAFATCGVSAARDVLYCWGLWESASPNAPGTPAIGFVPPILSVSDNSGATCEASGEAGARCWGTNQWGQLGDPDSAVPEPVTPIGIGDVVQVAVGAYHACALRREGTVVCWGSNGSNQCGSGYDASAGNGQGLPIPTLVPGVSGAVQIAAGGAHTCARFGDGHVACWGENGLGQSGAAGNGAVGVTTLPTLANVTFLAAGGSHTCAVVEGTRVFCWGTDFEGELGVMGIGSTPIPREVTPL